MSIHWNHILWSSTKAQVFNYTGWDHSVLYITCTVQHIYITAEMYGVVLYTDDVQLLHGSFLYMTSVPIHQRIGTQFFLSLNTDEVWQRTRLKYMYVLLCKVNVMYLHLHIFKGAPTKNISTYIYCLYCMYVWK
jgi:hypothetical protein